MLMKVLVFSTKIYLFEMPLQKEKSKDDFTNVFHGTLTLHCNHIHYNSSQGITLLSHGFQYSPLFANSLAIFFLGICKSHSQMYLKLKLDSSNI